jgi:membrane protein implicated in regulation of membrane protease activity
VLTLILILLLIAAIFGVLGAVLKAFLILILAGLLFVAVAIWAATFWFRRRVREVERAFGVDDRRARPTGLRRVRNEADRDPDGSGWS